MDWWLRHVYLCDLFVVQQHELNILRRQMLSRFDHQLPRQQHFPPCGQQRLQQRMGLH